MRALRTSAYPEPDMPPLTMVVLESDLKISAEKAAEAQRSEPGCLVVTDIFDVPDASDQDQESAMLTATERALSRYDADAERNMAILYYYNALALRVATAGVSATRPAPLTVAQVTTVFEQLAYHPDYKGQVVTTFVEDGSSVSLSNGHVTHLPPDSQVYR